MKEGTIRLGRFFESLDKDDQRVSQLEGINLPELP